MAKEYKLDIFDVMNAIDRRDFAFLDRLPEDKKAGFLPRVALKWASTVTGHHAARYIESVNVFANVSFDALKDHPDLQYRLLAMSGVGTRQTHKYVGVPKGMGRTNAVEDFVGEHFPMANKSEIRMLVSTLNREKFIEFVDQSGCTPEKRKEIIGAWDKKAKN